jgi:hypothetical protein
MHELKEFLEQHPHLQTLQDRLESEMDSVPEEYRLVVVAKHLAWNLEELDTELKLLRATLNRAGA